MKPNKIKWYKWIPKPSLYWLYPSMWKYYCSKPFSFRALWCRMCNHPCGIVYYNPSGFEPDYTCKNCGDEL